MRLAYLDCFSGVSGDMLLGALLDAGLPRETLERELARLALPGWELKVSRAQRGFIAGTRVEVAATESPPPRRLRDILALLEGSQLRDPVKTQARQVFVRLAEAEGKVHGTSPEEVHFHEVGAVDAIVDVVGAAAGLEALGVEKVVCSPLPLGRGWVKFEHGQSPVPAPAVAELVKGAPVYAGEVEAELTTPTGAAIVTTLCEEFGPLPAMRIEAVGYGAGSREQARPNLLRLLVGQSQEVPAREKVVVLETNLDDMSPELYDHVLGRLFKAGALDAYLTPILMKKNRPATLLTVLCEQAKSNELAEILFRETTTLGVRVRESERWCLEREWVEVETRWGKVRVKLGRLGGEVVTIAPEYDDCRRVAETTGAALKEVYQEAAALARVKR
jgi:hypothetical protein